VPTRIIVCGNRHTGVGCENDLGVSRILAEGLILQPVTEELLSEEAVTRAVTAMLGMQPTPKPDRRLAQLKRLVAEGILSQEEAAPAMDRLRPTETPEPYPFGAADAYREVVRSLRVSLEAEDIAAARPLLRDLIGPITAVPTESDGERYLTAHFPAFSVEGRLVAGAGTMITVGTVRRYGRS
jgi:hypothetical protein